MSALFQDGLTYSTINTARSALSAFLGVAGVRSLGSDVLINRFMKGIAKIRPATPRYTQIWDVKIVFNMFRQQPLARFLSLYDLTLRTVTLLALVSAQRGQSLHLLDIDCMSVAEDRYTFHLVGDFKQSRKGYETLNIVLPAFHDDTRLCIVKTLDVYLERTKPLRLSSRLFISTVRPFKPVSKDTIARWIKLTLNMAGVDVGIYKPHSTRAAATSAAHRKGVNIKEILNVAGWSRETTFARFYNRPLQTTTNSSFADAILRD